jgi:hypothetical protein
MYVSGDGTGLPMRKEELEGAAGKQEDGSAKTAMIYGGCVFTRNKNDEQGKPVRDHESTTYVSSFESIDQFGPILRQEALRRGMALALQVVLLIDGAPALEKNGAHLLCHRHSNRRLPPRPRTRGQGPGGAAWKQKTPRLPASSPIVTDRWPHAVQLLDFYHASQHLWALGHAHSTNNENQARAWVEKQLHQLRHGKEKQVIKTVASLPCGQGEDARIIEREKGYIESQSARMNYKTMARQGWPIGSGAVESACRQSQCRFKRPGQFWTEQGFRHLNALDEARNNNHWDELWPD